MRAWRAPGTSPPVNRPWSRRSRAPHRTRSLTGRTRSRERDPPQLHWRYRARRAPAVGHAGSQTRQRARNRAREAHCACRTEGGPREPAAAAGASLLACSLFGSAGWGARDSLSAAPAVASETRTCLLCPEADATQCHCTLVAEEIARRTDLRVQHIPVTVAPSSVSGFRLCSAVELAAQAGDRVARGAQSRSCPGILTRNTEVLTPPGTPPPWPVENSGLAERAGLRA